MQKYGMNIELPFQHSPHAFLITLGDFIAPDLDCCSGLLETKMFLIDL